MNGISAARDEVARRYLTWASQECRAEVDADFSRLRRLRSVAVVAFLDEIRTWSTEEAARFMSAAVRAMALGQPSPENREPVARLQEAMMREPARAFFRSGFADERAKRFDRRAFRRLLEQQLRPALGPHERDGSVTRFRSEIGHCTVCTDLDFGRTRSLTYWHTIYAGIHTEYWPEDARSLRLIRGDVSLGLWLGVAKSSWEFLTDEVASEVAPLIGGWCEFFLDAAGVLLDGINVHT